MEYSVKVIAHEKQKTACLIVGVFSNKRMPKATEIIDEASDGQLSHYLKRGDASGDKAETCWIMEPKNIAAERVLIVGLGKERDFDAKTFYALQAKIARLINRSGATDACNTLTEMTIKHCERNDILRQAVIASEQALYRFDQLKSDPPKEPKRPLKKILYTLATRRGADEATEALRIGQAIASGTRLTRDLANLPGNICTPSYLAEQAKKLKTAYGNLSVGILEEADMEKLGMGAFLSVSKGSDQPGKIISMKYQGAGDAKPIVLVGKGITFDTGGISLKPGAAMDEMKYDMGGAASVMGVMKACLEAQWPVNLVGVIASAENMPSGGASKPGDIVTSMSGQTIEILNTDAEGRLVLCDALTYVEQFNPKVVIDIATLTGACIVALGHETCAVLGNHSALINDLKQAGESSFDRAWELPLFDEYQKQLDSNFADMANIGGRSAGTITAGCFLSRFTKDYKWAHLDIAGTAWVSGAKKGATGRPVPLLTQYIMDKAGK